MIAAQPCSDPATVLAVDIMVKTDRDKNKNDPRQLHFLSTGIGGEKGWVLFVSLHLKSKNKKKKQQTNKKHLEKEKKKKINQKSSNKDDREGVEMAFSG